jgi:hypothetical protein
MERNVCRLICTADGDAFDHEIDGRPSLYGFTSAGKAEAFVDTVLKRPKTRGLFARAQSSRPP